MARIHAHRLSLGLSEQHLASAADVGLRNYQRAVAGQSTARASTLRKLETALVVIKSERRPSEQTSADLIRAVYGGFVAALGAALGIAPAEVHAQDPRRGATADPAWRAIAQVRQAAIYLTNTSVDVRQSRLADVLGLTPAAVCLGLRSVEDRRDDPAFDRLLDRIAADVMGSGRGGA